MIIDLPSRRKAIVVEWVQLQCLAVNTSAKGSIDMSKLKIVVVITKVLYQFQVERVSQGK